jgi:hypothetical protein
MISLVAMWKQNIGSALNASIPWAASLGGALLFLLTGCSTKPLKDPIIGPQYQVGNVYRREPVLPINLRRVAVLPISIKETNPDFLKGQDSLEPILHNELAKQARFELVIVQPKQLKEWTGKDRWDAYEELPLSLIHTVEDKTGAHAVFFAHLTEFKAYPPIVIGWRMKLVGEDLQSIWAVEEMFDAAEESISNSARLYDRGQVKNSPVLEDSRSILLSPRRFGQYTLKAVLDTLPAR